MYRGQRVSYLYFRIFAVSLAPDYEMLMVVEAVAEDLRLLVHFFVQICWIGRVYVLVIVVYAVISSRVFEFR